jgi:hypothetical protein
VLNFSVPSSENELDDADSRPKLVAGSPEGFPGHVDGRLREARMNHPKGFTVDGRGNIYVADAMNMAIRKISDTGKLKCPMPWGRCTCFCLFLEYPMSSFWFLLVMYRVCVASESKTAFGQRTCDHCVLSLSLVSTRHCV